MLTATTHLQNPSVRRSSEIGRVLLPLFLTLWATTSQISSAFSPSTSGQVHGWYAGKVARPGVMPGSGVGMVTVTNNYLESCGSVSREAPNVEQDGNFFWGTPRTEEEIIEYIANAVFEDDRGKEFVTVLQAEPPLVVIRGFLEDELCEDIIQSAVYSGEMTRSKVGTDLSESNIRTSSTVWLQEHQCEISSRTFAHRASRLSGLPPGNQENLQVVHYGPGQKFDVHTDHLNEFNDHNMARLATCLLYLNTAESNFMQFDVPKIGLSGGETWFPEFDAKVKPERGTVVFWWNTLERPGSDGYDSEMYMHIDPRSRHAGLPVLSGEKWVANRWIHPIDIGTGVRGY